MSTSRPARAAGTRHKAGRPTQAAARMAAAVPPVPAPEGAVPGIKDPPSEQAEQQVGSAATPTGTEAELPMVPYSAADQEPAEEPSADPGAMPLPKEYVILSGLGSYGPVRMGGKLMRTVRGTLYHVPDAEERADVLGTGRFRSATKADLARASMPSAGPGGAITKDALPPGALKGGLVRP